MVVVVVVVLVVVMLLLVVMLLVMLVVVAMLPVMLESELVMLLARLAKKGSDVRPLATNVHSTTPGSPAIARRQASAKRAAAHAMLSVALPAEGCCWCL
jgi:hypothetical protein